MRLLKSNRIIGSGVNKFLMWTYLTKQYVRNIVAAPGTIYWDLLLVVDIVSVIRGKGSEKYGAPTFVEQQFCSSTNHFLKLLP